MSDKQQVLSAVNEAIDDLNGVITRVNEGDIGFSEAGDWLHNWGYGIVSALERARNYIESEAVS